MNTSAWKTKRGQKCAMMTLEVVPFKPRHSVILTLLGNEDGTACLFFSLFFEHKLGKRSAQTAHFCAILVTHGRS